MPEHWDTENGCVRLCVAKGTLVPARKLVSPPPQVSQACLPMNSLSPLPITLRPVTQPSSLPSRAHPQVGAALTLFTLLAPSKSPAPPPISRRPYPPHQATGHISNVQFSTASTSLASLHPAQVPCTLVEAQSFPLQPREVESPFHNFQDMMGDLHDYRYGDNPQEGTTQLQLPRTEVQGGVQGGLQGSFVGEPSAAPGPAPRLNVTAAVTDVEKSQVTTAQQQHHHQYQYQHQHQHQQHQQLQYQQHQQLQQQKQELQRLQHLQSQLHSQSAMHSQLQPTLFGDASEQPAPVTGEATILSATILPEPILVGNDCTPEESTDAKFARPRAAEDFDHDLASAADVWKANEAAAWAAGFVADKSLDISQGSSVGTTLVGEEIVPECVICWGAQLNGGASCSPDFVPGKLHFKNKFCDTCKEGILIPLAQVRALSNELASCFANKRSEGFWNNAPKSMGGGQYRILNNTAGSIGPRLALFRDQPPPFQWQAISRSNPHFLPKLEASPSPRGHFQYPQPRP